MTVDISIDAEGIYLELSDHLDRQGIELTSEADDLLAEFARLVVLGQEELEGY